MDKLNIEIDSELKVKAEEIINNFHLEDVVVSFLEQVVLNKGLLFDTNDNN